MNVNLDSDLYILYGRRIEKSANGSLLPHEHKPMISAKKYNPVKSKSKGEGDNFPKLPLVRAHGTLMLIAWPLLGVSGIFFALWMQPALPKGQWFQVNTLWNDRVIVWHDLPKKPVEMLPTYLPSALSTFLLVHAWCSYLANFPLFLGSIVGALPMVLASQPLVTWMLL